MTPKNSDKTTVEGFLRGDPHAAKRVNEYLNHAVFKFRDRLGYEAEDVVSVARVKLYADLSEEKFRYDCKLSSYIWKIVGNVAIDFIRKRRVREAEDIDTEEVSDNAPNPEQQLMRKEDVEIGFVVVLLMSAECRRLWRMFYIKEMSQKEIAKEEGIEHGNVRQKLHVCKKKARALLRKLTEDD